MNTGARSDTATENPSWWGRLLRFVFFGNLFVGLLALLLSWETVAQLGLPPLSIGYLTTVFAGVIWYYTLAYQGSKPDSPNPRTRWYGTNARYLKITQPLLLTACLAGSAYYIVLLSPYLGRISWALLSWLASIPIVAFLYYGWQVRLPLSLRQVGWLKPFVIGWVWAGGVTLAPVVFAELQGGPTPELAVLGWYFLKNLMFVTVNAILFDIKDYADDANRALKTLVVQRGLRFTLFYVIIPLTAVGMLSALGFGLVRGLPAVWIAFNQFPFLLTLAVAYSMHRRRPILYYLIAIDGMLGVKAVCGILGSWLANR